MWADPARRWLVLILAGGAAFRLAFALYQGDRVEPVSGAYDQVFYHDMALNLLAGRGHSFTRPPWPFIQPGAPSAYYSFLYPLFLAASYTVAGPHALAARVVQSLVCSILPWQVFGLVHALMRGGGRAGAAVPADSRRATSVALLAAGITAGYAYFALYSGALQTEGLYLVLVAGALRLTLDLAQQPSCRRWAAWGAAVSLACLLRQVFMPLALLLLLYILSRARRRVRPAHVLLAGAIAAAFILPWTIRNYLVYDRFLLLNSQFGQVLWNANHPDLGTRFVGHAMFDIPADLQGSNEVDLTNELLLRGLREVASDPGRYALLSLSRTADFFTFWPSRASSLASNISRTLSFGVCLPFMLVGLVRSARCWRRWLLLYLFVAAYSLIHILSWTQIRYRMAVDLALIPFAGLAIRDLSSAVGRWRASRSAAHPETSSTHAALRLVLISAALALVPRSVAQAQSVPPAAPDAPVNLSRSAADSSFPAIAADNSGFVHVVWAENLDLSQATTDTVYYTRWDGTTWSRPVDILFSPEGNTSTASQPAAAAGVDGRLHVVWVGGWTGRIYHASAPLDQAGTSPAWTGPEELNLYGAGGASPQIAIDSTGVLHVVYVVPLGPEQGVYYLRSAGAAATWTAAAAIPLSRLGERAMLSDPRLALTGDGTLHAVWSWAEYPETFPPRGIYYARSSSAGETWTEPTLLAEGPFANPAVAVVQERQVHAVWSGTAGQRSKFHRWSSDGGSHWSAAVPVLTPGGLQGYAALAVDSAERLHWLTVTSVASAEDPLVHLVWDGRSWVGPDLLIRMEDLGLQVSQNMANAALAVGGGNCLYAAVTLPVGQGAEYQGDIYLVSWQTDSPSLAAQPYPTQQAAPSPAGVTPAEPEPTDTPVGSAPVAAPEAMAPPPTPLHPLVAGLASLLALLAAAVGVRLWKQRRRRPR